MIEVACYCGHLFSFSGDVGVCPRCGEYVGFGRVTPEQELRMREEMDSVVTRRTGPETSQPSPGNPDRSSITSRPELMRLLDRS